MAFIVNEEEIPTIRPFFRSVLSKGDVQTSSDSAISALTSVSDISGSQSAGQDPTWSHEAINWEGNTSKQAGCRNLCLPKEGRQNSVCREGFIIWILARSFALFHLFLNVLWGKCLFDGATTNSGRKPREHTAFYFLKMAEAKTVWNYFNVKYDI